MKARVKTQILLMALVLGAIALATEPASAKKAPAPPAITFYSTPRWETIPGTSVAWVGENQRPSYDLFRLGSNYYIYNNGYWYRSAQLDRKYVVIDDRKVPAAFAQIPNDRWRSYPPGWMNPKNPHYSGKHDNGSPKGHDSGKKDN